MRTADGIRRRDGNKQQGESHEAHSHISMLNFSNSDKIIFSACFFNAISDRIPAQALMNLEIKLPFCETKGTVCYSIA